MSSSKVQVLLFSPELIESSIKYNSIDGDVLALHALFYEKGYCSKIVVDYDQITEQINLSNIYYKTRTFVSVVIVHLFKADSYGKTLLRISNKLCEVRNKLKNGSIFIAYGSIAVSASEDLLKVGALDGIATNRGIKILNNLFANDEVSIQTLKILELFFNKHFTKHISLNKLPPKEIPLRDTSMVSLRTSIGCQAQCSFCSYNIGLNKKWIDLPIEKVVKDIEYLFFYKGSKKFAFIDSDFGGNVSACRKRTSQLLYQIKNHGLLNNIHLSLNIRLSTIDETCIFNLAECGVKTLLIGIESFSRNTRINIFNKHINHEKLNTIINLCDALGINIITSYIMWHPWQNLNDLRYELKEIAQLGRHRIPQFFTRSYLKVIPGTSIEKMIQKAGLLKSGLFYRDFIFESEEIAHIYSRLKMWYKENVRPVLRTSKNLRKIDPHNIAQLKINEYKFLQSLLDGN